jgi:hypothetical protein
MEKEIPDFSLWREVESASTTGMFSDGTVFLEVKKYEKILKDNKIQTGSTMCFFGKEILKMWSIFISDEEVLLKALKTDEGKWEVGLPVIKENSDSPENSKVKISVHVEGEKNPFVSVSMFRPDGSMVERVVFKNDDPPK